MTDRERILMNIAVDTAGSCHDTMRTLDNGWKLRMSFGHPAEQFIPEYLADKLKMPIVKGDVVRCQTNPNHAWGISVLEMRISHDHFLLRQIGGKRLLNMHNESVEVLRFMRLHRLYEGEKHRLYNWAYMAFLPRYNSDADRYKRCGGVAFEGDTLVIWSRSHIFAAEKQIDGVMLYAQPRKFTLPWGRTTKLKDIVAAMRAQGFAEAFEYMSVKPTEGNAGCVTLTRDDIVQAIQSV